MHTRSSSRLLIAVLLMFLMLFPVLSMPPAQSAKAQQNQSRFLITPYYGEENIGSWFDHRSPNYTTDNNLLNYKGFELDDPIGDPQCDDDNIADNCYDGHNGYDFGLSYERVLAAANGIVTKAGWDVVNCHNGLTCNYGLVVELQHVVNGVKYRTRYGHLTTVVAQVSQSILAGSVIGTSGSTGSSSGPHLHFDVYVCLNTNCATANDWRAIDPFGWQPATGADVTVDSWPGNGGHESWCMWIDGEWANLCSQTPVLPSRPITEPINGGEFIIDDTTNNPGGFSKGFGGRWNNQCTGVCGGWGQAQTGIGGHT